MDDQKLKIPIDNTQRSKIRIQNFYELSVQCIQNLFQLRFNISRQFPRNFFPTSSKFPLHFLLSLSKILRSISTAPTKVEWVARKWPNNLCYLCLRVSEFVPLPIPRDKLISLGGWRNVCHSPKSSWNLKIRYIICASRSQNLCSYPSSAISDWSLKGWRNLQIPKYTQ